ncbi:MAG: recombinase RecA [Bdellovibrionota bacterium]
MNKSQENTVTTNSKQSEKQKALELALSTIQKQFGKGSIMRLGADSTALSEGIPVFSTGSVGLDIALGIGGLPKGRIIEVFGPESSGKTTLFLQAAAECQKRGGTVAFIDAEHALDVQYAKRLGLKIEDVIISQPDTGEQALEITDMLVRSGSVDFIIVDSVAALVPRAEIEGEMGDSHMGLQARLMSQALRKLTGSINRSHCTVGFINQLRMKIGVMFGNPETTTGGNALKFYASIRLDIRRISAIKTGEEVTGSRIRVKVVKNKLAAPFKQAEFDVEHGQGVNRWGEIIDLATAKNVIDKSGSWYSYKGERMGQGRDQAMSYLKENPPLMDELTKLVFEAHGLKLPEGSIKTAPVAAKEPAEKEVVKEKEAAKPVIKSKAGHA